jgi:biotin synthase
LAFLWNTPENVNDLNTEEPRTLSTRREAVDEQRSQKGEASADAGEPKGFLTTKPTKHTKNDRQRPHGIPMVFVLFVRFVVDRCFVVGNSGRNPRSSIVDSGAMRRREAPMSSGAGPVCCPPRFGPRPAPRKVSAMHDLIEQLGRKVLEDGYSLTRDEALALCAPSLDVYHLMYWANRIRARYRGDTVKGCSIISVKTGACPEDCAFCAQSAHHGAPARPHGFVPAEQVAAAAREALACGSYALGVVASGLGPNEADMETYLMYLDAVSQAGPVEKHLDVGVLSDRQIARLKARGMACCGHNLETSRRFFPRICTTHTYDDRLATLCALRRHGVRICSGGILGLGEDWEDRVDLAFELRGIGAANVPLNFLHHIPGTPLEHVPPLEPLEILRSIALFRFILFDRDIAVCGGRERNLRDLQAFIFFAGANALLLGNYLTTPGRPAEQDRQLISDLRLRLVSG